MRFWKKEQGGDRMDIFDVIMIPLFLILILWSIIVLVISKKQRKKIENQEKKNRIFRHSLRTKNDNLLALMVKSRVMMMLLNTGNDPCKTDHKFKYHDYFKNYKK